MRMEPGCWSFHRTRGEEGDEDGTWVLEHTLHKGGEGDEDGAQVLDLILHRNGQGSPLNHTSSVMLNRSVRHPPQCGSITTPTRPSVFHNCSSSLMHSSRLAVTAFLA